MAKQPYKERLLAQSTPQPPAAAPVPSRSEANATRLKAAHQHLDRMFADAEDEQIDGRRFWGRIVLEIPFEGGSAQQILASKLAVDRCSGGR